VINVAEAQKGDCVWCLLTVQTAPVYGEIVRVLDKEDAIEVFTNHWGNRVVVASNAYWKEKAAKKGKIVKIHHNYSQWAQEYFSDEKTETNDRVDPLHNGNTENSEDTREEAGNAGVQKRSKRKQKVVRKSTAGKRKPSRSRKTRVSKK